ncbi:MAG: DNA-directed RNA polymerase specialized sigma24 family protein [Desulforhopalus sp.]|jgi:DNA-directed RNA polymerase specialized sigma24 family protein/ribosome-associated translation inhibitor RaiA
MMTQWAFHDCSENIKVAARSYWEKKQSRLERLAAVIPKGERLLRIVVCFHERRVDQYEVRAIMEVPRRSVAVQASDMSFSAALDTLIDLLVASVRKYKKMSRHMYRLQTKERIRADLDAALPLLVEDEKKNRKESFYAVLRPRLVFLEEQAKRELKILELEGSILSGMYSAHDLVNEMTVQAYEQFSSKPKEKKLEHWLHGILCQILGKIKLEASHRISLDEELHFDQLDFSSDSDWVAALMGYEEIMTFAELLPDRVPSMVWEKMDEASRQSYINEVLQTLSSQCRQAFLMNSIEDYSVSEISEIQNRPKSEVRSEIEHGREILNNQMNKAGLLNEISSAFDNQQYVG